MEFHKDKTLKEIVGSNDKRGGHSSGTNPNIKEEAMPKFFRSQFIMKDVWACVNFKNHNKQIAQMNQKIQEEEKTNVFKYFYNSIYEIIKFILLKNLYKL